MLAKLFITVPMPMPGGGLCVGGGAELPASNRPIISAMPPLGALEGPPPMAGLAVRSGVPAPAGLCSALAGAAPSKSMSRRFSILFCDEPVPLAAAAAATDAAIGFSAKF